MCEWHTGQKMVQSDKAHIISQHECTRFNDKLSRLLVPDHSCCQTSCTGGLSTCVYCSWTELFHLPEHTKMEAPLAGGLVYITEGENGEL